MECKSKLLNLLLLAMCILLLATVVYADTVEYVYDDAGRLIRAQYSDGTTVTKVIDYFYDEVGNRIQKAVGLSSIEVSPLLVNFGQVPEGQTSGAVQITVANAGQISLEIGDSIIEGANATEFALQNDLCSGQTLPPAGSCTFETVFSPISGVSKYAYVSIISDDPNHGTIYVALLGNADNVSLLAVGKSGSGAGNVTSDIAGIDCGTDCSEVYGNNTTVTLTATPEANSTFDGWTGGGCGTDPVCMMTLSADTSVVAHFNKKRPDLTVTQVSGTLTQDRLDITATVKNEGNDAAGISRLGVYLSSDDQIDTSDILISDNIISALAIDEERVENISTTLPARFAGGQYYVGVIIDHRNVIAELDETDNALAGNTVDVLTSILTVSNEGAGNGTVTGDLGGITCGADCTEEYITGLTVTLSATVDDETSSFAGWSGGGCSGTGNCVVTLNTATTVTATFNTTLPDLRMSSVSFPAAISPGETLIVPNTVVNEGGGNASGFHVWFYLSDDPVITTDDISLGGRYVTSLPAGSSNSASTSFFVSKTLSAGTFHIGAIVDRYNVITESKESNNTSSEPVEVMLSDLEMTEVSGPATVSPGENVMIGNTVRNAGTGTAYGFSVNTYLSADTVITTSDIRISSRNITALGAGAENSYEASVILPLTLEGGPYYLGAIADYNDQLNESVDDNNDLTGNQINVIVSDLVMTEVSAPATGSPGVNITIANTVSNIGPGTAYNFNIGLYLSTDAVITTSDTRIGWPHIASLAPGMDSAQDTIATIPANTVEGTYYVGAIADYIDGLSESDESNNVLVSTGQIQINYADLMMTAVSGPDTASPGASITISNTVRNDGAGDARASYVGIYLSTDNIITTSDTLIGTRYLNYLASGAESAYDSAITVPASVGVGTYYIGAIADYTGTVTETDETNNDLLGSEISITVTTAADLVMTSVAAPTVGEPGKNISVSTTARNQGDVNATYFYVGIYLSSDATITTDDTMLGYRYVSSLAVGATNTASTYVTIPATTPLGTYYIGAIADYSGAVSETVETNNGRGGNLIEVTRADLVMTDVTAPTAQAPGKVISVSTTAKNQGLVNSRSFYVGIYLSPDPEITISDTLLVYRYINGLAAGATSTASNYATIPAATPLGTYYIGAIADFSNLIAEPDESNNSFTGNQIEVTRADLVMTAVSGPTTANTGQNISISNTVLNQGLVDSTYFYVGIYLSPDPEITTGDTRLTQRYISSLLAGADNGTTTTVTIPAYTAPGTYYIGAIADYSGTVGEPDETNNAMMGNQIEVTAP